MKKIIICALTLALALCIVFAFGGTAFAEGPEEISTAEELLGINGKGGSYILTQDITLAKNKYIASFEGTLDGNGHSVTIDNGCGLFRTAGKSGSPATIKNLTVKGTVSGSGSVGAVAASAIGTIDNVTVEANVSSTSSNNIGGFANCNGKNELTVSNSTFAGTVTMSQGYKSANNYTYFGMFLGYNGGIFGGGSVRNSVARYTFTVPTSEAGKVATVEYFNANEDGKGTLSHGYTTRQEGENTVFTFCSVVNLAPISVNSISDEGIMSNYGAPVVRLTLSDGTYRYLDGFDRANCRFISDFSAASFEDMYEYIDISYLTMKRVTTQSVVDENGASGVPGVSVTSTYSQVTVNTAQEFESFARLINSAVPLKFKNENGEYETRSILDSLATGVKLGADIDLTAGDPDGTPSEFYGLGKQEFFPYRAGIDGDGHTLTLNINAPNGYCVGIIGAVSEMAVDIGIKDLTVRGSITGKTKVGIVGYFDMVCNEYIAGGNIVFENVKNYADVTGFAGVGGLLGIVSNAKDAIKAYVRNSENHGNITLLAGGSYAGGIVGIAGFYGSKPAGVDIRNTVNTGNVTAGDGSSCAGGIIGCITNESSVLAEVSSSGNVTAGQGAGKLGKIIGETRAVKYDGTLSDIGSYATSPADKILSLGFEKSSLSQTYGYRFDIKLNAEITPEHRVSIIFEYDGEQKEINADKYGYYSYSFEPGEYTLRLKVSAAEGYLDSGVMENGTVLEAESSLTVSKQQFNFEFTDVSTAYTGGEITYFNALESSSSYNKDAYKIPNTSQAEGAKWVVTYYQGGALTGTPKASGEYEVHIDLDATEKFASRYAYDTETSVVRMKILKKMTVSVDYKEIVKGVAAEPSVSVNTYDGTAFTDTDALELVFDIDGRGYRPLADLGYGSHSVGVTGVETYGDYYIEYVGGTVQVVATQGGGDETSSGGKKIFGCKGTVGSALIAIGALGLVSAFVFIRKKH